MTKNFKTIISLMSGTSVDEIDAVAVKIYDNNLSYEILNSHSIKYPETVSKIILETANNRANTAQICALNFIIGELFAKCANELLEKMQTDKKNIDFISSHGQTVYHIPQKMELGEIETGSTLQLGDISVISEKTGIMTIGDFRTKDMAAGGQGAPLVPFADEIIFGKDKKRGILNIGGISNITILNKEIETFAFDIGPGNMLIDYFAKKLFNVPFDKDGYLASEGNIDENLLREMMSLDYYKKVPPKSTGRELFSSEYAENLFENYSQKNYYDIMATVTAQCAYAIFNAYKNFIKPKTDLEEIVIGGGGAYNKTLVSYLKKLMPELEFNTHEKYNIGNKQKEPLAFAYLGYMTYMHKNNNIPNVTGAKHRVSMGKISY